MQTKGLLLEFNAHLNIKLMLTLLYRCANMVETECESEFC